MESKRQLNVNRDTPFKVVAAGFPVMRFSSISDAEKCFRGYKGPGTCLLVSYETGRAEYLKYKFLKG
ncbi:hypothetical protein SAMN05444682_101723 [Parapedobacter indicus]|uniref:Uncharacterized protein n=1 Tax=Parapedobacter indicus TaxID=1477437 RepID=A0A1I3E184_9SPHI|nr:hypothetical protein CLV26_101737 [Parapedobacter indicus]SFH92762.1 hypothetical protein SAMN05444682_101723 [Parapedobacter indicus]